MEFVTFNIPCNIISGIKDNGNNSYILKSFNLTEPLGYMIVNIPTNVLFKKMLLKTQLNILNLVLGLNKVD